jgi:hypothetical protein
VLFAADENILIKAANEDILNQKIKRVIKQFLTWFDANALVINTQKTTAPLFHDWQNRKFFKTSNQI